MKPVTQGVPGVREEPIVPVMTVALAEARQQGYQAHKKKQRRHAVILLTEKMEDEKCQLSSINRGNTGKRNQNLVLQHHDFGVVCNSS